MTSRLRTRRYVTAPEAGRRESGRVVTATEIGRSPRRQIAAGISSTDLRTGAGSAAGVLWLDPHARLEVHVHPHRAHHLWIIAGSVEALGRRLRSDSYAYVPAGEPHGLVAGVDGATVFYLELPEGAAEALPLPPTSLTRDECELCHASVGAGRYRLVTHGTSRDPRWHEALVCPRCAGATDVVSTGDRRTARR
jgi:quercetin dioxygenase-like cupin family protein